MTKYKLTYFDFRGLGEGARLIFHQAGVQFEDCRITQEEWRNLKPKTPFGKVPVLEVDGNMIAESAAIYRYLGRQFGLVPKDPIEEAQVDAVYDASKDFANETAPFARIFGGLAEGDQDKLLKDTVIPATDRFFPQLEKFLTKAGSGFLVGKSLTWADLAIFDWLVTLEGAAPQLFDGHTEIKKFIEHIRSLPNIRNYLAERPKTAI